jgi:hypothetical protein
MSPLWFWIIPILLNHRLHGVTVLQYITHPWSYICITSKLICCLTMYIFISLQKECVAHHVDIPSAVNGFPDVHVSQKSFFQIILSQHQYKVTVHWTDLISLQVDKNVRVSDITLFKCFNILPSENWWAQTNTYANQWACNEEYCLLRCTVLIVW